MKIHRKPFAIIIPWPWWYRLYWGFTFWPFVFLKYPDNRACLEHELTHIRQQVRHWIVWFWIRYLWQLWRKGYRQIDYEIEAYKVQAQYE